MSGAGRPRFGAAGLGALLVGALVLVALGADWIAPYDPGQQTGPPYAAPSRTHWLGTNDIGQDILSELVLGTRVSLGIGAGSAIVAATLGLALGVAAGYCRGHVDAVVMATVDVVLTIPFLPLMILLSAYLGPGHWTSIAVIGALTWARPARVIRAQTLSIGEREHVTAVRALGASRVRVMTHHLLPEVLPLAIAQFVLVAGNAIALEAALSFLGLGDPLQKSWGTMLAYAQARNAFLSGTWPWWVLPPGLMISAAVSGFALMGLAWERKSRR